MAGFRHSIKQIGVIAPAQILCVVVGLWMHHQFVRLYAEKALQDQAWSDMALHGDHFRSKLARTSISPGTTDTEQLDRAKRLLAGAYLPHGGAFVVDAQWRVVAASKGPQLGNGTESLIGTSLTWQPLEEPSPTTAGTLRGEIQLADGTHLASANPLIDAPGHVVVHRAAADVATRLDAITASLPAISGITLLWIGALLAVVDYLVIAGIRDRARRERAKANKEALAQTRNLMRTRDAVIFGLAKLADSRDPETGDHLERIAIYSEAVAAAMQRHPKYKNHVDATFVGLIRISSALHDIGKVGIEDRILRKPGPLTDHERASMQTHTRIGGDCLRDIEQRLGSSNFLAMAREIALAHHEWWDGTGYPNGLRGEGIPLAARIVAIADVYDALSSRRVYKPPFPHGECVAIIKSLAGKQFDPDLVDVWLSIESRFGDIALRFRDSRSSSRADEAVKEVLEQKSRPRDLQETLKTLADVY